MVKHWLTALETELMQYWPPFCNCLEGSSLKQKEHFSDSLVDHLSVSLHCDQSLGGDDELQHDEWCVRAHVTCPVALPEGLPYGGLSTA